MGNKVKVKVWVDADKVVKASDINLKDKYKEVMQEIPKGEKAK